MRSFFWIRIAGVVVALLAAGLISFPSFPGTGTFARVPVNRTLKGDRLPSINPAVWPHELGLPMAPAPTATPKKIPVGCEPAFSPISAPRLAGFFGRCTT